MSTPRQSTQVPAAQQVTTYPAIIGSLITQARTEAGLRQEELAERSQVPQSTLSRIERGSTHLTLNQLRKIAPALGRQPSQIVASAEQAEFLLQMNGAEVKEVVEPNALKRDAVIFLSGVALTALIVFLAANAKK
jgi:transcriptional regulator with XRE-family HTH domain